MKLLNSSFAKAFVFAGAGVWASLRSERNLRVHLTIATLVTVAGWICQLAEWQWLTILMAFGLVMGLELINTAVESLVDLVTTDYHRLAKTAKDAAAGAVLVAAGAAAGVGLVVFVPHLGKFGYDFMVRWRHSPSMVGVVLVVLALSDAALWSLVPGERRRRPEPFR